MKILVTGGAGFIGSHTLIELYRAGHSAVVVDNLYNSDPEALKRVAEIIGVDEIPFVKADIRDREALEEVFAAHRFDACIHFAGLKAVGESVAKPLEYYENNMNGTFVLLDVVNTFVKVNGVDVPYEIKDRRTGDIATCYCDPAKAAKELGWKARYRLEEMCRDSWNWQKNNPNGYQA